MIWQDDFTGGDMQAVAKSLDDGFLRLLPKPVIGSVGGPRGPVAVAPSHSMYAVSEYSVVALYNFTSTVNFAGIFSRKRARDESVEDIYIQTDSLGITLVHNRNNGGTSVTKFSNPKPSAQTWHVIGYTYDGDSWRAFIDGTLVGVIPNEIPPLAHQDYVLALGQGGNGNDVWGALAWITFWSRALSESEMQSLVRRIPKPDEPGLLGAWLLNEGSGTIAQDWSSVGNAATLFDAPWNSMEKWFGVRVPSVIDLSSVGVTHSSFIAWTAQEPPGTSVTIETNLSLDGGQTWQGWQPCIDGDPIPGITPGLDLSNARLKVWEHLHTELDGVEPVLESLTITVGEGGVVGHETFSDVFIKSYAERRTRSDIVLTTAARRDTLSELVLTTWPPHNTFSEVRLTRPVKRDTLAEVRVQTKNFFEPEPPPGGIWKPLGPGSGIWTRVPPGEKQPWKEGVPK